MSYIRWSSDIKNVVPFEEEMKLYAQGKGWEEVRALKEARGAVFSDWYIYYHSNGGYINRPEVKEDQLLSIWHRTMDGHLDTFTYGEVRDMYDRDDWSAIHCTELTQKEVMRECVAEWLQEVEDEFT